jgi:hypothetical protein
MLQAFNLHPRKALAIAKVDQQLASVDSLDGWFFAGQHDFFRCVEHIDP